MTTTTTKVMKRDYLERIVSEAWKEAEDRNDGFIVLQLHPDNKTIVSSLHLGNSWESMGLNAYESEKRILYKFDSRYYDVEYWEGEEETEENRLEPEDYEGFNELVSEIEEELESSFDVSVEWI